MASKHGSSSTITPPNSPKRSKSGEEEMVSSMETSDVIPSSSLPSVVHSFNLLGLSEFLPEGDSDALPEFKSISKLPVGQIFKVCKIIKRDKGVENCKFPGIQLYLNDADNSCRTALPKRFYDYFTKHHPEQFELFQNSVKTFKIDGYKPTQNGNMVLVSFPNLNPPEEKIKIVEVTEDETEESS